MTTILTSTLATTRKNQNHEVDLHEVDLEEWLSPKQVAERAGVHVATVRRYLRAGLIPYHQLGRGKGIRIQWGAYLVATQRYVLLLGLILDPFGIINP